MPPASMVGAPDRGPKLGSRERAVDGPASKALRLAGEKRGAFLLDRDAVNHPGHDGDLASVSCPDSFPSDNGSWHSLLRR